MVAAGRPLRMAGDCAWQGTSRRNISGPYFPLSPVPNARMMKTARPHGAREQTCSGAGEIGVDEDSGGEAVTVPFKGVINIDVNDSTPDWEPYLTPKGAGRRAKRAGRAVRRHRARGVVAVRRAHRDADAGQARRQGPDLLPVAHHGAVLADALLLPDRAQPPPERVCVDLRRLHRVPRFQRPHPNGERLPGRGDAREGLEHLLARQEPQRRRRRSRHGRQPQELAVSRGFDRFYGFLGGETNQWYPILTEDNHFIDQPYLPEEGYHLSKDLADKAIAFIRDSKQSAPDKPWYLVLLSRRQPCPAPRARRSGSTSTRASSTTATRRTASGCCRG